MAATAAEVASWVTEGREKKALAVISVCDTFDWEDYPVYVYTEKELEKRRKELDGKNMQRINKIIRL